MHLKPLCHKRPHKCYYWPIKEPEQEDSFPTGALTRALSPSAITIHCCQAVLPTCSWLFLQRSLMGLCRRKDLNLYLDVNFSDRSPVLPLNYSHCGSTLTRCYFSCALTFLPVVSAQLFLRTNFLKKASIDMDARNQNQLPLIKLFCRQIIHELVNPIDCNLCNRIVFGCATGTDG